MLLAAAEGARRLIVDELGADFVPLYRTVELEPAIPPEGDVVAARVRLGRACLCRDRRAHRRVAIGPQTAAAARELGLDVAGVAESHDLDGLLEVVASL